MIDQSIWEAIIFKKYQKASRYTQNSPVNLDVWMEYLKINNIKTDRLDLILTPHHKYTASELFKQVSERLMEFNKKDSEEWAIASSGETVVVRLTFAELMYAVLPLSDWYQHSLLDKQENETEEYHWLKLVAGAILFEKIKPGGRKITKTSRSLSEEKLFKEFESAFDSFFQKLEFPILDPVLYSVSRNRPASISIDKSIGTTKADAGRRLFDIDGSEITWAVLDTGIDARHSAFRSKDPATKKPYTTPFEAASSANSNHTRVVATYDFTRFREVLAEIHHSTRTGPVRFLHSKSHFKLATSNSKDERLHDTVVKDYMVEIGRNLKEGRLLDWTVISPLLRIPHNDTEYVPPVHPHGTHVAGIIAANASGEVGSTPLIGMCPGIELYDIRVLDENGAGEEFNILAALQFVRWLNNKDGFIIHGANLSFSMIHEVASYACGQTPVCEACERLVAEGTIVVAAAGNLGQALFTSTAGLSEQGFRMVNITDPGNAEAVITVGATHRNRPHTYGISYFSSKGPTGDGRVKPDLVAPGEKIVSCIPGDATDRMDGTSMAAPHVSGAAALLLAKHRELVGKPKAVKEILCKTATDLGREKYFQGSGMLDVLRAIQSV